MKRLAQALTVTLALGAAGPLSAAQSDWTGIAEAEVRLIAGHVPGEGDMLGLHFVMAPGWKVYWRSPGDAGFPPVPHWEGSTGVSDPRIEWPWPKRFTFYGLETFGYEREAVLPVRIGRSGGGGGHVVLKLDYAACSDICVPVTAELSLDLPGGPLPENRHAAAIAAALDRVPQRGDAVPSVTAALSAGGLDVAIPALAGAEHVEIIVETTPDFVLGRPECRSAGSGASCVLPVDDAPPGRTLAGEAVTVSIAADGRLFEARVTVRPD